jgi:nicotinamide-nucleotide amidase
VAGLPAEPHNGVNPAVVPDLAARILDEMANRKLTLAVAESLTGGLLVAEFVAIPGASRVLSGGVVAYNTALKASVLGVDADLLSRQGPVDPTVAGQMASGVCNALAIAGMPADIGLSTTGVAGPGAQDGHPAGTAFISVAFQGEVHTLGLRLEGTRETIRAGVVSESLQQLGLLLGVAATTSDS